MMEFPEQYTTRKEDHGLKIIEIANLTKIGKNVYRR